MSHLDAATERGGATTAARTMHFIETPDGEVYGTLLLAGGGGST